MKDGKALWMNKKAITPKAIGETWVLNNTPIIPTTEIKANITYTFVYNNVTYESNVIKIGNKSKDGSYIKTNLTELDGTGIIYAIDSVMVSFAGWRSESCRTLTFLEPPTGNLLTWLQANGTKQ